MHETRIAGWVFCLDRQVEPRCLWLWREWPIARDLCRRPAILRYAGEKPSLRNPSFCTGVMDAELSGWMLAFSLWTSSSFRAH
jgi:hypothetical protein